MELLEELRKFGVDIDEGLARMMGKTALYEKMLHKFSDRMEHSAVMDNFEKEDSEELIKETHTIKGMTGNLSLTPLYNAYSEIVRLLREDEPGQARKVFEEILPVQNDILSCIEKYKN